MDHYEKKNMKKIPIPSNINWSWNMGFMLLMTLMIQTITGMMISMNLTNSMNPFNNNMFILINNNWGWTMRMTHMNFPSFMFIILFIHMKRNLLFNSFKNLPMWTSGMMIIILMMTTAFSGYIIPWSQMSYWGMMVITNMISIIPYIGKTMMIMMWGNFNINIMSMNRMMIIHFILPMIMTLMVIIHLNILHKNYSFNQMGLNNKMDMISFNKYFMIKDIFLFMMILPLMTNLLLIKPFYLNNNDNFMLMNYISTPNNIEPEWYFMFFYSILRTINNKMGGMITLMIMMLMISMLPLMNINKFQSNKFYPWKKMILWMFILSYTLISMMGFKKMNYPFTNINLMTMKLIFMQMFSLTMSSKTSDLII